MKHNKYKFVIDPDVVKKYNIRNIHTIDFDIRIYLNFPDGWVKYGYFFEPVLENEAVLIRLSSPATIKQLCGYDKLSCAEFGGRFMYLNSDRWFYGSAKSKLGLSDYRQYMVTHEMGHILGHDHEKCPCKNCPAPLMMQQTLGIGECKPNIKLQ